MQKFLTAHRDEPIIHQPYWRVFFQEILPGGKNIAVVGLKISPGNREKSSPQVLENRQSSVKIRGISVFIHSKPHGQAGAKIRQSKQKRNTRQAKSEIS